MVTTGPVCSIKLLSVADKDVPRPALSPERLSRMGHALLVARKRSGLDQGVVAEKIGVDSKTVSRLENGKHPPQLATLDALATLYQCSIDELMGRDLVLRHVDGSIIAIEAKSPLHTAAVGDENRQPNDVAGTSYASPAVLEVITKRIDDLRAELKVEIAAEMAKNYRDLEEAARELQKPQAARRARGK